MITAKVLLDSVYMDSRLTTMQLTYPRFVHCFHEKTEFLSQISDEMPEFRSYDAVVTLAAKVAEFDNGEIQFVHPLSHICEEYNGPMVTHKRKTFELCVTPNHRMHFLRRTTRNVFLPHTDIASEWVNTYTGHRRIFQAANLKSQYRTYSSPDEAALIAFFVADGHATKQKAQFHFRKLRKVDRVIQLLTSLKIEFSHRIYGRDHVINFESPFWVTDCYYNGCKRYPDFLFKMDSESFDAFKQATLESDGDAPDLIINTSSVECASQIQVLSFLNNVAMNMRQYGEYLFKQRYQTNPYVSFRSDKNKFYIESYCSKVVCFSVPSSYLCVRYKGFAFVSGNSEYMTHRMFSRNAASSRAIPIKKTIKNIILDPVIPIHWGKAQRGMQAWEEVENKENCEELWLSARDEMITIVNGLIAEGLHKQIANRLLEPWMHIVVIHTATEWENFFKLRCHEMAEPHMQSLAYAMRDAYESSEPVNQYWHMPLTNFPGDEGLTQDELKKVSIARCARVSYLTHDGKRDVQADINLFQTLYDNQHMSPFEHCAHHSLGRWGNFEGWKQLRYYVERKQEWPE